jgi:hypothetical protein
MPFKISGEYVATCACNLICPCPIDGTPTGPKNQCFGSAVFHVDKGSLDGVDLSGVNVAEFYHAPSNFSAGDVKIGLVVDAAASDKQVEAIEQIFSGKAGGPFAQFAPLISSWEGVTRAKVTYTGGKKPSAKIEGVGEYAYEPAIGADGTPTIVKNSAQAWRAGGYQVGPASGKAKAFGISYDAVYGESGQFEFAS